MQVIIALPNENDSQYLVDSTRLMEIVNIQDLRSRKSQTIEDKYHINWFSNNGNSIIEFELPSIYIRNNEAFFHNGRHRTILLCRHTKEIPISVSISYFNASNEQIDKCKRIIEYISLRKLKTQEQIEIPSLPIEYMGYDHNLGK